MQKVDLVNRIVHILDQKHAKEINAIDISNLSIICDYFIIATGNTNIQVRALTDSVFDKIKEEYDIVPQGIEGYNSSEWVILDYADVVVHIFDKQSRDFYCLDKMWSDGIKLNLFL